MKKKDKKIIFCTPASSSLANKIAKTNDCKLGKVKITKFLDKEILVLIEENIKDKKVYVIGSTNPPSDNLLELLILIHTLKVNGAKKVILIIPYFGYAKSDHIYPKGAPIAALLMVKLIEASLPDEITVVDLHSDKVYNFFKRPLKHLSAIPLLAEFFKKKNIKDLAIASPDKGGIKRAENFAKILNINKIIKVEKCRPSFDKVKVKKVQGDIRGKNIIIVDDMIQSGGTILKATEALKKQGAKNIYVAVTHLVFSGPGFNLLNKNKNIHQVIFTDSILPEKKLSKKFKKISIASLLKF